MPPTLPSTETTATSTDDRRTNDATSGPQEWLTGRLHYRGTRSVRSPLRRAPLLATPIATPLQCGRLKRPGLLFNFSLSERFRIIQVFRVFRVRELAGRSGSASETPPLNPPKRPKEVGVARRHTPKQQGKRYSPASAAAKAKHTLLSPILT